MTEVRGQKTEDRRQRTDDGGQKTGDRNSEVGPAVVRWSGTMSRLKMRKSEIRQFSVPIKKAPELFRGLRDF